MGSKVAFMESSRSLTPVLLQFFLPLAAQQRVFRDVHVAAVDELCLAGHAFLLEAALDRNPLGGDVARVNAQFEAIDQLGAEQVMIPFLLRCS